MTTPDPASIWVRPVRATDTPSILRINEAAAPGVSRLTATALADLTRSAALCRVGEHDGEIVGYLVGFTPDARYAGEEFRWFRTRYEQFLYIDQVAVAEAWRGRGVGSILYTHAAAYALARRCTRLVCEVNLRPRNPGSLRFHTRQGFTPVGMLEVSDGRLVSLRVKELVAAG